MSDLNMVFDAKGQSIAPPDLIWVKEIPWYNYEGMKYEDPGSDQFIKGFEKKYGYVSYFLDQKYIDEDMSKLGWIRRNEHQEFEIYANIACLDPGYLRGTPCIVYRSFWVEASAIVKLKPNLMISSIFGGHPWQLEDFTKSPTDSPFLVEGMERFELVKRILETPYEELCKMHNAAIEKWMSD